MLIVIYLISFFVLVLMTVNNLMSYLFL